MKKFSSSNVSLEVRKMKIQLFFMRSKIALGESVPPHSIRNIKKSIARELSKKGEKNNA